MLLPPNGQVTFIVFPIRDPLLRTKSGNQFVVIIAYLYSKLTCTFPTHIISSTYPEHISLNQCVVRYTIPELLVFDSGQQFCQKSFISFRRYLGVGKRRKIAHCSQKK